MIKVRKLETNFKYSKTLLALSPIRDTKTSIASHLLPPGAVLIKLIESEIKFILKLQIGQILTMSKSDLSGI